MADEAATDETLDLFTAVAGGDLDAVRRVLRERPDLARCKNADTLPVIVFARYIGSAAVLDALLDAGPPLDLFEAAMVDRVDDLRRLLDADPSSVSAYSDDGFTALHFAGFYGAPRAAEFLVERRADVNAVTRNFLSNMPLHAAAAGGYIDICRALLERGANVNAKQHGGFTPLHTAGFRGDRPMIELFLAHGADAAAANDEGHTPADSARSQGHLPQAALLRSRERPT